MSDLKASCFKLSRARLQRSQKQTTGTSRQRSAIRTSHQSSVDAAGDTELDGGKTSTGRGQCDVTVTSRFGLAPVTLPPTPEQIPRPGILVFRQDAILQTDNLNSTHCLCRLILVYFVHDLLHSAIRQRARVRDRRRGSILAFRGTRNMGKSCGTSEGSLLTCLSRLRAIRLST